MNKQSITTTRCPAPEKVKQAKAAAETLVLLAICNLVPFANIKFKTVNGRIDFSTGMIEQKIHIPIPLFLKQHAGEIHAVAQRYIHSSLSVKEYTYLSSLQVDCEGEYIVEAVSRHGKLDDINLSPSIKK